MNLNSAIIYVDDDNNTLYMHVNAYVTLQS